MKRALFLAFVLNAEGLRIFRQFRSVYSLNLFSSQCSWKDTTKDACLGLENEKYAVVLAKFAFVWVVLLKVSNTRMPFR